MKTVVEIAVMLLLTVIAFNLFRLSVSYFRDGFRWHGFAAGFFASTSTLGVLLTALDMTGVIEWPY